MTRQQIKWASSHDWFIRADGDTVIVSESIQHRDGSWTTEPVRFASFDALRAWAGY